MRAVIQKVASAEVEVAGKIIGKIGKGLLVFLAIHVDDTEDLIEKMAEKIIKLRIFEDSEEKMNLSLAELELEILVVSQFTLYGDTKKGNRPSFTESAKPEKAISFYEKFVTILQEKRLKVETGEFGSRMSVRIVNDGPTTVIVDF